MNQYNDSINRSFVRCKLCGEFIVSGSKVCPSCGKYQKQFDHFIQKYAAPASVGILIISAIVSALTLNYSVNQKI